MQDRIKTLDGVLNFRDFGGYPTMDGRRVATGKLYRTASFAEASEADIAWLEKLGAKFIVDLRRPEEREGGEREAAKRLKDEVQLKRLKPIIAKGGLMNSLK